MPSDALDRTGELFSPSTVAFRSAVTDAVEQVRAYIEAHAQSADSPGARAAAELGVFASGHIDEDRFAALFGAGDALDTDTLRLLDRALAVLRELSNPESPAFMVEIGPDGDVAAGVAQALAMIGRAFGAARVAELVRTGRTDEARHMDPAAPYPFARWTSAERRIAPPLIARVTGANLNGIALGQFLDGAQKIVLVIDGPAPAAPLARLIAPKTFVMQTTDVADAAGLAAFDGPGIVAVVPQGCALFTHDPSADKASRLTITARPEGRPRAMRGSSVFQQDEALAMLDLLDSALSAPPVQPQAPPVAAATGAADAATVAQDAVATVEPADTLAAWLLAQAGLNQAGEAAGR